MASEDIIHKVVDEISFGLISPKDMRKQSVVEIQTPDTYDEDGAPITTGLMDGRLGTLEPRQRCKTCGNTAIRCPGHFGHIELAVPIVHIEFTKIIFDLLRSTCRSCGRILLSEDTAKKVRGRIERFNKLLGVTPDEVYKGIIQEIKTKQCPHCAAAQYKITFEKPTKFIEQTEAGSEPLTPSMIRERLERISDEDLEILGLNPKVARPEWMVLQVLPVPPVYVRPSITLESGIRSEDDLTHKLVDIIRINQRLKENMEAGAPTLIIQDLSELLQYHVTTYFNNEASGIPPARHRSGRALKTLSQRLKGKEGRFRSNLSGKRVDFSARTVISPDPNLDINEVGVPHDVAMRLSVPEKITAWNIEEMKKLVINGPEKYPGALYIIRPDGKRIRLEFVVDREKIAEALEIGFVVERHLKNGDIAIFNRQPSLHRMSIMAHYVRVLPYKTFRLHLCVCPPYNADFDGDEMNLHVPQSEEARTEALLLMQVQDQILSPRFGGPIIGAIRDFITGAYFFTRRSNYLTKAEINRLLTATGYSGYLPEPKKIEEKQPLWSGKQIFSLFLPKTLNYVLKANICQGCAKCEEEDCKYDAYVVVKNGELVSGIIDRRSIGAEQSESLLHRIIKDYGTQAGREFLNKITRLLKLFLTMRGFTYTYDQLVLSPRAETKIKKTMERIQKRIDEHIENYRNGTLPRLPGQTLEESFEIYVMHELATARDEAGKIADQDFTLENAGIVMTRTGARGSSLNIGQMSACVGQQSVRGKRILRGYSGRALPHFTEGDPSPRARGFVYSSYQTGLDAIEFFFHAMGGREGLVDTAVRTQQSGYMQRRLINALEHIRLEYDGTVRDSAGDIIQFMYGEDGVDPAKSDHGKAVNVSRLIDQIKIGEEKGTPASADYVKKHLKQVEDQITPILSEQLRQNLAKTKLSSKSVDKAITLTAEQYKRALMEPGEAVGVVAAQSIGEPGTQMTLRTFHYAGVKEQNVTLGLPRLIEIVDARRIPSTPIMTIYLTGKHGKSKEGAVEIARNVIYTTLENLASAIYEDPVREEIVVEINNTMMEDRGITMDELKERLQLQNATTKVNGDTLRIKPKKVENLKRLLNKISAFHVKGIADIKRVLVTEESGEWVIRTDGSNLSKVLEISGVDTSRTTTNNVHEIAKTLGVEASRNALIHEAKGVLEEQGLDVDVRHVMLVADMMTSTGEVQQIGRHGISGQKTSVLARAAFEITVPNIVEAAVKGEKDPLEGVTENVIVGQSIPIGTGLVELYMSTFEKQEKEGGKTEA